MNINPYLIYILALLKAVNFNCILTEQIIKGENINKCDFMKIISVARDMQKVFGH